jgi:monoamine oxidase
MNKDFDVVIVGGGAAGIGAARELAASGRSALLLEASSRLGGRAWTCEIAGQRLDLGCGWLHSGDRNSWTRIAEEAGRVVDRRPPKWGVQYRHLGFSPDEQKAARGAFAAWMERLSVKPPPSDCAADALTPGGEWNGRWEPWRDEDRTLRHWRYATGYKVLSMRLSGTNQSRATSERHRTPRRAGASDHI